MQFRVLAAVVAALMAAAPAKAYSPMLVPPPQTPFWNTDISPSARARAGDLAHAEAKAAGGDVEAMRVLAAKYWAGDGAPHDLGRAVRWLRAAALEGDARAMNDLGLLFLTQPDNLGEYENIAASDGVLLATGWLQQAAAKGLPEATFNLGKVYAFPYGDRNAEAARLFELTAARAVAKALRGDAFWQLGVLVRGDNSEKPSAMGLANYRRAAKLGQTLAIVELGRHAPTEAERRYWRSVQDERQLDFMARPDLGARYDAKQGSSALAHLREDAGRGSADAMYRLGQAYLSGALGLQRNPSKAAEWFKKAVGVQYGVIDPDRTRLEGPDFYSFPISNAAYALAQLYDQGLGVPKDPIQAAHWRSRSKAARSGPRSPDEIAADCRRLGAEVAQFKAARFTPGFENSWERLYRIHVRDFRKSVTEAARAPCSELNAEIARLRKDDGDALARLTPLGDADDVEAMVRIGLILIWDWEPSGRPGEDKPLHYDEGSAWLKRAATAPGATTDATLYRLGYGRSDGRLVAGSFRVDFLQPKAEAGDVAAMTSLGFLKLQGAKNPQDPRDGVRWLRLAGEKGHLPAIRMLMTSYRGGNASADILADATEADRWLLRAAEAGDVPSMIELGRMYQQGTRVRKDAAEAMSWFRKAWATCDLAGFYVRGEGVERDPAEAVRLYRSGGDCQGRNYQLALLYAAGEGGVKDTSEALRLFGEAATRGDTRAAIRLADIYANGWDVRRDQTLSARWRLKAAQAGNAPSMYRIGRMYMEGEGFAENRDRGAFWLSQAARHGEAPASLGAPGAAVR